MATTPARAGETATVALGAATVSIRGVVGASVPDVPVTVTVVVPVVALPVAVRVKTLVVVVLVGLNEAVTPEGRLDAGTLIATLPLKPFWGVTVIVLAALPPCTTLGLFGDAEIVKLGLAAAVTVTISGVVGASVPEVPVTVTVVVPVAAPPVALRVKTLVVAVLAGLNDAVTPEGRLAAGTLKATLPLKPFWGVTVIVVVALPPCTTLGLVGDAEIVKLGCGGVVDPPLLLPHPVKNAAAIANIPKPHRLLIPMPHSWI